MYVHIFGFWIYGPCLAGAAFALGMAISKFRNPEE